jgi:hypothetical protein
MRRRRQVLQVSTFPFLAVLLCAMGSLILLLLVMDRRAKAVAVARARQEIARILDAKAAAMAEQSAEAQRRRQARHEALDKEKQAAVVQLESVRGEIARSEHQGEVMRAGYQALQTGLQDEEKKLGKLQQDIVEERKRAGETQSQSASSSANLARLNAELMELERTLANLKALRREQQQTYSLVPYGGRHGDTRRPLYVECASEGLIFHPDRKILERWDLKPAAIRAEAERRIDKQRALLLKTNAKVDQRPYLLMLVRPDGIINYYKAIAALQGLDVDYGYEFIEADWALDFPENDDEAKPQPWTTVKTPARIATSSPSGVPVQGPRIRGVPSLGFPGANANAAAGSLPIMAASGSSTGGATLGATGEPGNSSAGPPGLPRGPGKAGAGGETREASGGSSIGAEGSGDRVSGSSFGRPRGPDLAVPMAGTSGARGTGFGDVNSPGAPTPGGPGPSTSLAAPTTPGFQATGGSANGLRDGMTGGVTGRQRGPDLAVPMAGASAGSGGLNHGAGIGDPTLPSTPGPGGFAAPATAGIQSPTLPTVVGLRPGTYGPATSPGSIQETGGPATPGSVASSGRMPPQTSGVMRGGNGSNRSNGDLPAGSGTGPVGQETGGQAPGEAASSLASLSSPGAPQGAGSWVATTRPGSAGSAPPGTADAPGAGDSGGNENGIAGTQEPGGGGGSGAGRLPIDPRMLAEKTPQPRLPLYTRLTGGRDWIITIECLTDGVVLRPLGQRFGAESLRTGADGENALSRAVREMIERRQASVRSGEMPYRPQIRFLVKPPDGLRSYYAAYPALESLRLTMTRENFVPVDESKLPPMRKE